MLLQSFHIQLTKLRIFEGALSRQGPASRSACTMSSSRSDAASSRLQRIRADSPTAASPPPPPRPYNASSSGALSNGGDEVEPAAVDVCSYCKRTSQHDNPCPKKHAGPKLKFINKSTCCNCRNFQNCKKGAMEPKALKTQLNDKVKGPERLVDYSVRFAILFSKTLV